jgi:hypothetical protein
MRPSEGFEAWVNAISLTWDVLSQRPWRIHLDCGIEWSSVLRRKALSRHHSAGGRLFWQHLGGG